MPGEVVSSLLLEVSKRSWTTISHRRAGGFCPGGGGFPPNPERLHFSALGTWVAKGGKARSFLLDWRVARFQTPGWEGDLNLPLELEELVEGWSSPGPAVWTHVASGSYSAQMALNSSR